MEKKYRLEPFDLERAKAGEPICTMDGKDVRIICWDCKQYCADTIVALITLDNGLEVPNVYELDGNSYEEDKRWTDLMMKVEVKEPYIYAEVAGEITPFEELKAEEFIDLKSLEYLIIKTHDGKLLKVWKKNLPEKVWKEAQIAASEIGDGWRCPTRHECIDIYDTRFKGLDDALEEIGGDNLKGIYWTSEADSDPRYYANHAVFFGGSSGSLFTHSKFNQSSVRPVQLIEDKNVD